MHAVSGPVVTPSRHDCAQLRCACSSSNREVLRAPFRSRRARMSSRTATPPAIRWQPGEPAVDIHVHCRPTRWSWLKPLCRRAHLMVSVDVVQRQQAADSLDESDHMACAVQRRLPRALLYEGAPSVEDRILSVQAKNLPYSSQTASPVSGTLSGWPGESRSTYTYQSNRPQPYNMCSPRKKTAGNVNEKGFNLSNYS